MVIQNRLASCNLKGISEASGREQMGPPGALGTEQLSVQGAGEKRIGRWVGARASCFAG